MHQTDDDLEEQRLAALHDLEILDTPPEQSFDRIVALARFTFRVPIALISLIDRERQWFKAQQGVSVRETKREVAVCDFTIRQQAPLIIPDTTLDARTCSNPDVVGNLQFRFYAGAPLVLASGHAVGSLCILDVVPRDLTTAQVALLQNLAGLVVDEFEQRLAIIRKRGTRRCA
jgi:GAF domain-containing protein